ncbi:Fur family transcriptional regulator [Chloroflexota bacterium]
MNKSNVLNGTRKTKQREAILKVLKDTDCHPNAQWIYEQVRREISHISLGTVYRDLKILKEMGKILELDFAGNTTHFDGITKQHYHFYCQKCNSISDIEEPVNPKIDKSIAAKNGFKVFYHRMDFFGLCRDCRS